MEQSKQRQETAGASDGIEPDGEEEKVNREDVPMSEWDKLTGAEQEAMEAHPFWNGGASSGICIVCDGPVTTHKTIRLIEAPIA